MAYKEREINKMYYTMGEVAILLDINLSMIRFYEREFEILVPKKGKSGTRYFNQENIETLKLIIHLIKEKGYTLQGAKDFIKNKGNSGRDDIRVINSLENLKKFLIEVRDQL
jgi:DNA-binding transcriptional MerR regulator